MTPTARERVFLRSFGAGTLGALGALVVFAVVAPASRVRVTAARDSGFGQLSDAVMPGLLIAVAVALIAGVAVTYVTSRGRGLSYQDLRAERHGLTSGVFVFLAGSYLLAFRPMANLFNVVDLRYAGEAAWLDVSPPQIAIAVGVLAVWLWSSLAIGLAISSSARASRDIKRR